jgi:hypothetical protein
MRKLAHLACTSLALLTLVACGQVSNNNGDDAGNNGDDGGGPMIDAGADVDAASGTPDAGQTAAPPPGQELVPGGSRVTGGGFTMDVQIGNWTGQQPVSGGGTTVEGNAPVKD